MKAKKTIKVMVAGDNAAGVPDFFFCKIKCTEEQYNEGRHYDLAMETAEDNGYEPKIAMDENDDGGRGILNCFVWESASVFTVK